jgi:hypothetical protein
MALQLGDLLTITPMCWRQLELWIEQNILPHEIQISAGVAWDLEEAVAPQLLAGDLLAARG